MTKEELLSIAQTSEALKWISDREDSFAYPDEWKKRVPLKVRMNQRVQSEIPLSSGLFVQYEVDYFVKVNSYGAVTAILKDGRLLGLKPGEFTVIEFHPKPE